MGLFFKFDFLDLNSSEKKNSEFQNKLRPLCVIFYNYSTAILNNLQKRFFEFFQNTVKNCALKFMFIFMTITSCHKFAQIQ